MDMMADLDHPAPLQPLDEIPDEEIAAVVARLVDDDTAVPALDVAAFNSAI